MSEETTQTYYVRTTKEGEMAGLADYEEVCLSVEDPGIKLDPTGALMFVFENQEVIIYAPGMWAMVSGGGIE